MTRSQAFCEKYKLKTPVLLAPMAGACPVSLSIAVANAGSMGAMGALMNPPSGIRDWVRAFLASWGPEVAASAGDATRPDFGEQCETFIDLAPQGIAWFATATTVEEARQARDAGADAIIAQGFEAGGHRGSFDQSAAERQAIGLFALLPRMAEIDLPSVPRFCAARKRRRIVIRCNAA